MKLEEELSIMNKILSFLVLLTLVPNNAIAQIIPDSSLGAENSVVESNGSRDTINGGAIRDANLFHSFQEFNVEALREAYFTNPDGIANIFSRVTGNNISDIQGVLGVLGDANLYLINPNGILFGENARLDVNGSFFATSADSVLFDNGFEFSAANPNQPPLLTIDIPIGLRFRDNPGDISNSASLLVNEGKSIALIGGNVSVENGGILFAPGGRIELGGLMETGTIGIADGSSLIFPDGVVRGNVSVTDSSIVAVFSGGGGSIGVNAKNFNLTNGSRFLGGIGANQGSVEAQAGDITLNATDTITVSQGSGIFNQIASTGVGNAGGIEITTTNLSLIQGVLLASTFGQGDAGVIEINASGTISAERSGIVSQVAPDIVGNAGGIEITTTNLFLTQGSEVTASTFGQGDAGAITISASGTISAEESGIFSQVAESGNGSSGGIEIKTTNLSLRGGGQVDASNLGQGNAGKITINASGTISADGKSSDGTSSGITSQVTSTEKGSSGGIEITTTNLSLRGGGQVDASTFGNGNAGKITINASGTISADGESSDGIPSGITSQVGEFAVGDSGGIDITTTNLSLTQGGRVNVSTFGQGNAGAITVDASDTIFADGESSNGINSGIRSQVAESGEGFSEGIKITTTDLSLTRGGIVSAITSGNGNAGAITIKASGTISADGKDRDGFSSGIVSQVEESGVGNSGEITITTTDLLLTQGGAVSASTFGNGNAGAITINALVTISADGKSSEGINSGITSRVGESGVGNSGELDITTTDLLLTQGGAVSASTLGTGDAGAVTINASGTISADGKDRDGFSSGITSRVEESGVGNSGEITITTTDLLLTQGGGVNASTLGIGNAGKIRINASDTISADGFGSFIASIAGNRGEGKAADINITTNNLSLRNDTLISVQSFGQGNVGNLFIQADSLALENGSFLVASTPVGTGGSIFLTIADNLTMRENSTISARATRDANGGNVNIDAEFIIAFPNQNNDIIASASQGRGGEINITTEGIFGLEERSSTPENETNDIDASSQFGLDGEINITRPDVDPASGLLDLTQDVVDPAKLIAQNVCTQTADSEFIDIGKGGLPQNPGELLTEDSIEVELVTPITVSGEAIKFNRDRESVKTNINRKLPAQGWIFHENGIVELVAYNPNLVGEQRIGDNYRGCQ